MHRLSRLRGELQRFKRLMERLDGAQQHLQEAKAQLIKAALAVEIRMRAFVTIFVVYIVLSSHNLLHAPQTCSSKRTRRPRGGADSNPSQNWPRAHGARARRARTILFLHAAASVVHARTRGVHARIRTNL
jgi:hypothetical protein